MVSGSRTAADVIIIGDGLIGLSTALALGGAGAKCTVVGRTQAGAASAAAAGLLVPASTNLAEAVRPFFMASLARYPAFVASLQAYDPALTIIKGLVETTAQGETLRAEEGAVDNVRLLAAVRRAVEQIATVTLLDDIVMSLEADDSSASVMTRAHGRLTAGFVVVAAGAWSSALRGLPRPLPVRPLKGQMIALGRSPLSRATMGEDVYLVPRGGETLVGATVEEAGFDTTVTPDAVRTLQAAAAALCPALDGAPVVRSWAGIRPATPDMLPIIGPDPDAASLLYACGHSKNGILLAPATAEAVASWCRGVDPGAELGPFSITRFA